MLFQGADGLHQTGLEAVADGHDLTGGLHLGAQSTAGGGELIKGQAGDFQNTIVQGRFKASGGLAGNGVGDLVQGVAQGDLSGHLGDGIAGGLGRQGGGTGDTRVDLDDRVLEGIRVQGELAVTAALNFQGADDVQGGGTEHLILLVGQGLAGRHHDGVAGMDAHRVDVLHAADGDDVASAVPHDFKFDFLPACDTAFDQNFMDTGQLQTTVADLPQHELVIGDAAAGAAQGIGGTDDDGQADGVGELHRILHGVHHLGDHAGLVDGLHGVLEALAILCPTDGVGGGAQELDAVTI